ncbi:MAG: beta-ketoacyl-[acyl-carrier-protein] synthase II [Halobacteriovoraceae bacterium]|nr:beta-ketoacyl-[acyl-carrier-protein] synthase II [Halobacteriovoraceae bacterium]|tara:strand:- start:1179 stop:2426 length:1248 start_codon:yes stop_codon:yes gene_type:complete
MQIQRVAITGVSAICGLGNSMNEVWDNALKGQSGISLIEGANPEMWPVVFAGQVRNFEVSPDIIDPKEQKRFDTFIHYALHAADEAVRSSGLLDSGYDPLMMGSIMGVGLGGFPMIEEMHTIYHDKGPRRVSPFFIPGFIPNMTSGKISLKYNMKGVNYATSSACASASHAIGAAAMEIMMGRQDSMVTGGAEAVLSGLTMAGFSNMKALSKWNDRPSEASRPFDKERNGFVMGEGAGIIVLENLEKAKARGAKIIAEVVGFGATADAYHITAPEPEGAGTVPCMEQALRYAGINKEDIDYINAHGTSTPLGDIAETKAIKKVFGDHAYKLNVSSTKSMHGHLLGAAGGLESVMCIKALETGTIPPTINLNEADPECDLNYTANEAVKREIRYALNNSFGFGGTNSTTIFKKFEG